MVSECTSQTLINSNRKILCSSTSIDQNDHVSYHFISLMSMYKPTVDKPCNNFITLTTSSGSLSLLYYIIIPSFPTFDPLLIYNLSPFPQPYHVTPSTLFSLLSIFSYKSYDLRRLYMSCRPWVCKTKVLGKFEKS